MAAIIYAKIQAGEDITEHELSMDTHINKDAYYRIMLQQDYRYDKDRQLYTKRHT